MKPSTSPLKLLMLLMSIASVGLELFVILTDYFPEKPIALYIAMGVAAIAVIGCAVPVIKDTMDEEMMSLIGLVIALICIITSIIYIFATDYHPSEDKKPVNPSETIAIETVNRETIAVSPEVLTPIE